MGEAIAGVFSQGALQHPGVRTLAECESIIQRGQQTFVEVGDALLEIRDHRLYRERYATFEEYCQQRWGWTHRHANRLIQATVVVGQLRGTPGSHLPPTEHHARELLTLLPDDRPTFAQKVDFAQTTVRELHGLVAQRRQAERNSTFAGKTTQLLEADLPYGRVVQEDALRFLDSLPTACVDLCVTSPPYWAKRTFGGGALEIGQEPDPETYIRVLRAVCHEIARVLAPHGWLFLNVADTYASQPGGYRGDPARARGISASAQSAAATAPEREWDVPDKSLCLIPWRLVISLVEDGWRCRNVNVWHKLGHQPENVLDRSAQAWEPVFQLTRSEYPYYVRGRGDDDHWDIPVGRQGRGHGHPAVFPEGLVERIVSRACPEGGVLLDPFAGSGTVLDVATQMGRRFLGCDLIAVGGTP